MAIAESTEFEPTEDRSTPNYDAITEKVGIESDPPPGLIVHTAGFTDEGVFRIYNVWESQEDADRFRTERLMPVIEAVTGPDRPAQPPTMASYELHNVVKGR